MTKTKTKASRAKQTTMPEGVEWVTIQVPVYTGAMNDTPDRRVQAALDEPRCQAGWARLNEAMRLMHEPTSHLIHLQHHRANTVRWLFKAISEAISDVEPDF